MKVKILNNLSYQTFPISEDMIEIDDTLLDRIGIDKQFDSEGNIVDFINIDKKLTELTTWFDRDYPKYEQMLTRRGYLNIQDKIIDTVRNKTYTNLTELYTEAEIVAEEIRNLKDGGAK